MSNNKKENPLGDLSKEEFVEWTTEGFPLKLEEPSDFMIMFADFVNKSQELIVAMITEDFKNVFLTVGNEPLLRVIYDSEEEKVKMLTHITEELCDSGKSDFLSTDLNEYELKKYLGEACLGVIAFCKGIESVQKEHENATQEDLTVTVSSQKFKPWLL